MYSEKYLNKIVTIEIDRPLGSKHPKYNTFYAVNYGYVPHTKAPDGDAIDAYLLGVFEPVKKFTGLCIAIIQRKNDDDDKLIIVPEGKNYSDEQIYALTEFQECYHEIIIIRP